MRFINSNIKKVNDRDESHAELVELHDEHLPLLSSILTKANRHDPFSMSAAYYAMTGREGLWLYRNEKTMMVVCRHPNRSNQILLFPPIGGNPRNLLIQALTDQNFPKGEKQLSRISNDDESLENYLVENSFGEVMKEQILDWTYPVHILSVEDVIERKGGRFNNFRGHINRALREGYFAERLDLRKHKDYIESISDFWARDGKKSGYSYEDLTMPTKSILHMASCQALNVSGVVIFNQDRIPLGFWIWDEPSLKHGIAMSMVRMSIGNHGAAEFAALKMCEHLKSKGYKFVCTGGSETKSLDDFKRKLGPIESIELKSIKLYDIKKHSRLKAA